MSLPPLPDADRPGYGTPSVPPYGYAPPPIAQRNGAATTSLILGILSDIPGWLSSLVSTFVLRSYRASATNLGMIFALISFVSLAIAIAAVICGHIGFGTAGHTENQRSKFVAVAGLTLGYSRIAGIIISFLLSTLTGLLLR